jgi:hypothetical protein
MTSFTRFDGGRFGGGKARAKLPFMKLRCKGMPIDRNGRRSADLG